MSQLTVVRFSEAFERFWPELAAGLGLRLSLHGADEAGTVSQDAVALLLAAGGAERDALRWLTERDTTAEVPTLAVGSDPDRRMATQVVARGASDYFVLPEDVELLRNGVEAAATRHRTAPRPAGAGADAFGALVGESARFRQELQRAAQLAAHRHGSALILGETGTGKELVARAIHAASPRRDGPFVAVNCSALPEHLVESELFGHERGAFTDAHAAKPGLFEVADTGTLFLDEIGDLPLALQAKLLRVLEDREIRRVGGTKARAVDVRILAATHENLPQRVRERLFREDLYYRLSTVVLTLPALHERGSDVVLIARALLAHLAKFHQLPVPELPAAVEERLCGYPWPGNVRELKNALERAFLLSPPGQFSLDELFPSIATAGAPAPLAAAAAGAIPFPAPLHEITTAVARATLAWCNGNRSESARQLGISTRRLRRLLAGGGLGEDSLDLEACEA